MKGMGWQGLMKGRVENRHLRDTCEPASGDFYAEEIGRVVERGQRDESPDRSNHLIVDDGRLPEEFPSVDHTMADTEEFGLVLNDPVLTVHLCHELEPFPVIGQLLRIDLLVESPVRFAPGLTQTALLAADLLD